MVHQKAKNCNVNNVVYKTQAVRYVMIFISISFGLFIRSRFKNTSIIHK
jgi:hypothetical protein